MRCSEGQQLSLVRFSDGDSSVADRCFFLPPRRLKIVFQKKVSVCSKGPSKRFAGNCSQVPGGHARDGAWWRSRAKSRGDFDLDGCANFDKANAAPSTTTAVDSKHATDAESTCAVRVTPLSIACEIAPKSRGLSELR